MSRKEPYLCPTCGAELPYGARWHNGMILTDGAAVSTGARYNHADIVANARLAISALDAGQREVLRFALGVNGKRKGQGFTTYKS